MRSHFAFCIYASLPRKLDQNNAKKKSGKKAIVRFHLSKHKNMNIENDGLKMYLLSNIAYCGYVQFRAV